MSNQLLAPPSQLGGQAASPLRSGDDLAGSVSAQGTATSRRPRWPLLLSALCFVQYTALGWWLMSVRNYAIYDSMFRTLYAKQMTLSADPHLAAMGFYWMPLPTVIRIPFVLLMQPFGHAELAGPLSSAAFAALTVLVIVRTAELLGLSRAMVVTMACIYAFSPITVYMGANGMSESIFGFFTAITLYFFLKWRQDGRPTTLILMAVGLAGATMCRYEALLFVPVLSFACMCCVERGRRLQLSIVIGFPAVITFAWWSLASLLIQDDVLYWLHASKDTTALPPKHPWLPESLSTPALIGYSLLVIFSFAPAFFAIFAGAISSWRRWRTSIGLIGTAFAMPTVITYQLIKGKSWAVPRFYILAPIFAIVGVMWVLRMGHNQRRTLWIGRVGVGLLVLGGVTGSYFLADRDNSYAEGEFAFFGPLLGKETAGPSVANLGENIVYMSDLRPLRNLKADLDPLLAQGNRAATQSLALSLLLSDEPGQYIAPEDRDFEQITSDPIGRFKFVVLQPGKKSAGEATLRALVSQTFPDGTWLKVRDYQGAVEIFEWVPDGEQPLLALAPTPAEDTANTGSTTPASTVVATTTTVAATTTTVAEATTSVADTTTTAGP